jgi:hypothetical protein
LGDVTIFQYDEMFEKIDKSRILASCKVGVTTGTAGNNTGLSSVQNQIQSKTMIET